MFIVISYNEVAKKYETLKISKKLSGFKFYNKKIKCEFVDI